MNINTFDNYYFIGIGGIGMSALARYFHSLGKNTAGYDRTRKEVTHSLEELGIAIHYQDNPEMIASGFRDAERTLVVYTPAVPQKHQELAYFRRNNFRVMKRAAVLGLITNSLKSIAVAGTHGKTTISSMLAHILHQGNLPVNAFLGGILNNYRSNLLLSSNTLAGTQSAQDLAVVEADEYDRSFLHLSPVLAVISAIDADHLDIYGTFDELKASFHKFIRKIAEGGSLLLHRDIYEETDFPAHLYVYTYALEDSRADFYASNIRRTETGYLYDIEGPGNFGIQNVKPAWPSRLNIENAVAAAAAAWLSETSNVAVKQGINSFSGIWRRFDVHINKPGLVYIDDYAHHPREIEKTLAAVRDLFPDKKVTGIFQPHLYSRTRDFAEGFARALDSFDELLLLPVYPAREQPIPGVTSELIYKKMHLQQKMLIEQEELIAELQATPKEVVLTMGAGDIDSLVDEVSCSLLNNYAPK